VDTTAARGATTARTADALSSDDSPARAPPGDDGSPDGTTWYADISRRQRARRGKRTEQARAE
jgi:hypothetical protein